MAKERATTRERDQRRVSIRKIALLYPVLGRCMLDRNLLQEGSDKKAERFYDSTIQMLKPPKDASGRLHVAVCEFSAGQKLENTKILEIQATYFIGFSYANTSIPEADERNILREIAEGSAWPLFRDLFIHIGSQSAEELPMLPNVPKMRWLKAEKDSETE